MFARADVRAFADAAAATNSPTLANCILWGNHATTAGKDIWMNQSDDGAKVSHSIVTAGGLHIDGSGNTIDTMTVFLHDDPMLVDTMNNDLRLKQGSPAIGAGLNQAIASASDLDGKTRLIGARVDMGAYEHGTPDDCNQNVFLHPQEFIDATETFETNQLIFATNKITSGNITYDALLGTELGLKFEVAPNAIFQIFRTGCP